MTTTTTTAAKKHLSDDILAQFNLYVTRCGYEMQKMRSGLLSNSDAVKTAVFEQFSQGFLAIKNAIDYTKLLGGEGKGEQIQAMKDFALSASEDTKEASDIVQNMLDKFSTEYQMTKSHNVVPSNEQVNNVQNVEKESRNEKNEDCCTP